MKSIVIVSLNNNKFLAILTCINKDLFIILPITKKYILKHKIKIKKNNNNHSHNKKSKTSPAQPSPAKTHSQKT